MKWHVLKAALHISWGFFHQCLFSDINGFPQRCHFPLQYISYEINKYLFPEASNLGKTT